MIKPDNNRIIDRVWDIYYHRGRYNVKYGLPYLNDDNKIAKLNQLL